MQSATTTIRVARDGPVSTIRLARPEQRNAFNPTMIAELTAAFRAAGAPADPEGGADAPRVVVLAGAGDVFSAGADLAWMRAMAGYAFDENVADALRLADLFTAIRECPLPVIARVQGAAMGGGSGLVAACDLAVAAEDAQFAFSEARLGLVPAVISPYVIPKIGVAAATELFLTGERFDAARARAIGLVCRVVPAADLDLAVAERVEALCAAGPDAQAAIKRLIPFVASTGDPVSAREYTAHLIADRRASDEGREGMAAFLERRKARWLP
ncbi:enoyl-CoA hydratase [bacterium]|nr:MAG: enoyl-CoA hydratase [bacterium]